MENLKPVGQLSPFKNFCISIGALPSSYKESMTYAELLFWFCDYLENTVIPAINSTGEAVTELQEKYIELKNYVDTYFENLDVQNEINKKLDIMATDGTLSYLLSKYVQPMIDIQNNKIETIENSLSNLSSGSPKGSYLTLEMLISDNPDSAVYIVQDNMHIYSYVKNSGVANDLGPYLATEILDNSIDYKKVTDNLLVKQDTYYSPAHHTVEKFILDVDWFRASISNQTTPPGKESSQANTYIKSFGFIDFKGNSKIINRKTNDIEVALIGYSVVSRDDYVVLNPNDFEYGGISQTGDENTSNIWIRSNFIAGNGTTITVDPFLWRMRVFIYDENQTFIESTGDLSTYVLVDTSKYYRLVISRLSASKINHISKTKIFELLNYNMKISSLDYNSRWKRENIDVEYNENLKYMFMARTQDGTLISSDSIVDKFDSIKYFLIGDKIVTDTLEKRIEDLESTLPLSLNGKTIAVVGDSISTMINRNAYEITITEDDVGVELSAYPTYYDIQDNLAIGGHTFTESEVGTEISFTPLVSDIGKSIGKANNYYNTNTNVWWQLLEEINGATVIPVCWSGSSMTSHEKNILNRKTSYAWHEAQIRKCGIRTPGTMERTSPDMIIIYRGTNDFSHSPYSVLTENTFEDYNYSVPNNDIVEINKFGYKEAYAILISKLKTAYPKAKIYVCTLNVFKRINYSHFPTNNGQVSLPKYNNAIREIADFFGCECIELDKDGITFENCYSEGYITDSATIPTHPSTKGHKLIYDQVIKNMK